MTSLTPDLIEIADKCYKFHIKNKNKKYYMGFKWDDVLTTPQKLTKLLQLGILSKGYWTNSHHYYEIVDEKKLKKTLVEFNQQRKEKESVSKPLTFKQTLKIPEDLFTPIVGFEDLKTLFMTSIKAPKPVHILLHGPPASAKTIFLLEVARLKGSYYALGSYATKAGLTEQLLEQEPKFLLIDEIEKLDNKDLTVLLSLCETGIVKVDLHNKHIEKHLDTKVYAACNKLEKLPKEIQSRFMRLTLPKYTEKEFIKIAFRTLMIREKIEKRLAEFISKTVARDLETLDIRDVIKIARLSKTKAQVNTFVELMQKYGSEI